MTREVPSAAAPGEAPPPSPARALDPAQVGKVWALRRGLTIARLVMAFIVLTAAIALAVLVVLSAAEWWKDMTWATGLADKPDAFMTALIVRAALGGSAMVFAGVLLAFVDKLSSQRGVMAGASEDVPVPGYTVDARGEKEPELLEAMPPIYKPFARIGWHFARFLRSALRETVAPLVPPDPPPSSES